MYSHQTSGWWELCNQSRTVQSSNSIIWLYGSDKENLLCQQQIDWTFSNFFHIATKWLSVIFMINFVQVSFFFPFHYPNNLYLHKEASCPCTEVGCPWVVGPCASGLPLVSAPWAAASEGRGCRCLCWRSGGHSVVFLSGSAGMKIEAMVDLCWVTAAAWRHARLLPSSSRHLQRKT